LTLQGPKAKLIPEKRGTAGLSMTLCGDPDLSVHKLRENPKVTNTTRNLVIAAIALLLLPGCGILNQQDASHATQVELSSNNFTVRNTNVEGVDSGWGLLFSFAGLTFTRASVNEAMDDLMDQVDAEGRSVALVNVTRTHSVTNWILFHVVQQRIRADVVEFTK